MQKQQLKSQNLPKGWRKAKITRDANANVKILKSLEKKGLLEIYDVMLENGRENKKIRNKILPVGVCNHSRCGECVVGSDEDNIFEDICKILGKNKIEDAMHLEAHIRNKHDYFITEDKDFLQKKEILKARFAIEILTPIELQKKLYKK